jgi:ribosomal protein S18 acetylase RimI-like enzyme
VVGIRRSWHWAGSLSERIDCWLARLRDKVTQRLVYFQGLRSYRRIMRALLSRSVAYYVGLPEGRRWLRYHRIGSRRPSGALVGHHWFHLVAKFAGICLGSVHVEAGAGGFWLQGLYVRIRFRGLGVGSNLLAFAATAASRGGARVLLASVEPANTAALHLFTKMGFHKTGGLCGNQVSLRQDL